jgi:hypothetical protein
MLEGFRASFLPTTIFVEEAYAALERLDADAIRMRSGNGVKQLIEEVLPLAALLKYM